MTNTDQLRKQLRPIIYQALRQIQPFIPVTNGSGIKAMMFASDLLVIDISALIEQHTATAVRAARIDELKKVEVQSPNMEFTDWTAHYYIKQRLDALKKEGSDDNNL